MKKFTTLLALGLSASLLCGCASLETPFGSILNTDEVKEAAAMSEPAHLTFWADAADQGTIQTALTAYNATQEQVSVTCTFFEREELTAKISEAAQNNALPSMWTTSPGPDCRSCVENGLTYDLTQFAMKNSWDTTFRPAALSMVSINDSIAGYPTSLSAYGVYYNKSLFTQAGLKVPETFEDLENVCAVLKTSGILPFALAGADSSQPACFLECLVEYFAGSASHDRMLSQKSTWNNDAMLQATALFQKYSELRFFHKKFNEHTTAKSLMLLRDRKAAMIIFDQGGDFLLTEGGMNPGDFGWFAFPSVEGRVAATGDMVQLSSALTENEVNAAVDFLDYYMNSRVSYDNSYFTDPMLSHTIQGNQPNTAAILSAADEKTTYTLYADSLPAAGSSVYAKVIKGLTLEDMTPSQAALKLAEAFG